MEIPARALEELLRRVESRRSIRRTGRRAFSTQFGQGLQSCGKDKLGGLTRYVGHQTSARVCPCKRGPP